MPQANEPLSEPTPGQIGCPASTRLSAEDARWFAEEVQSHEPALRSFLRRLVASLSDVDDLVQECYLRVMKAKTRAPIRSTKAFLFTTARNAAHDLRRRRAVSDPIPFVETDGASVLMDERDGVVDSVCRQQELALLAEAIRTLPKRCHQVFLLRKIQLLPQKEIARRLGISESTVETLVARGVASCAEFLRRRGLASR